MLVFSLMPRLRTRCRDACYGLYLQLEVAQYINGEMPGLPRPILSTKPIRGLCQRLKGKSGRFRGNLSGASFTTFASLFLFIECHLLLSWASMMILVMSPLPVGTFSIAKLTTEYEREQGSMTTCCTVKNLCWVRGALCTCDALLYTLCTTS